MVKPKACQLISFRHRLHITDRELVETLPPGVLLDVFQPIRGGRKGLQLVSPYGARPTF
jgi:hypothetical protein